MTHRIALLTALCAYTSVAQDTPKDVGKLNAVIVKDFYKSGTFFDVVATLVAQIQPGIAVGFAKADGPDPKVTISTQDVTLGEIINQMILQDNRYRVVTDQTLSVPHIVPRDDDARSMQLLKLRIQRFDIVTDDWPNNLLMRIPEFSPEIATYLGNWYARESRITKPLGSPGANMTTDVPPPHVEIHLRDVTVMQVLDALADWNYGLMAGKKGTVPKGVTVWPLGWKCEVPEPDESSLNYWLHLIFSRFP